MEAVWALLSLLLPAISTLSISQRLTDSHDRVANGLSYLVIYAVLQLLPIQLLGVLQLTHLIRSVSLFKIALVQLLVLLVLSVYFGLRRSKGAGIHWLTPTVSSFRPMVIPGGIVAGCYLVFLVDLITSYPTGWDALSYHLPLAVRWLQEGSFRIPQSRDWHFSLPGNAETSMMVLLGTGWQPAATLIQLLATIILAAASYVLARRLGASQQGAAASVLILLSVPIVTFQTFSGYVDLYGAAFFLAGVALFLCRNDAPNHTSRQKLNPQRIILSGLASGVAIGTKPTFYVYGAMFCLVTLSALVKGENGYRRRVGLAAAALVGAMLLPSVFWFVRATAATGNPIYPLKVEVFGQTMFNGYSPTEITPADYDLTMVRSRTEWLIYPWTEWKKSGYNYATGSGLGAAFATFVPVGFVSAVYRNIIRRRNARCKEALFIVAVAVLSLIWWFTLGRMLRFGIPLIAFSCVLSAPYLDYVLERRPTFARRLLVVSLATTCLLSAFEPIHSLLGRVLTSTWTRAAYYGVPEVVDDLPTGSCVLNSAHETANFPLAGKGLSNKVILTFEVPSPLTVEFLRKRGVDYVVKQGPIDSDDLLLSHIAVKLISENSRELVSEKANGWRIWMLPTRVGPEMTAPAEEQCIE